MAFDWDPFDRDYRATAELHHLARQARPSPGKVSLTSRLRSRGNRVPVQRTPAQTPVVQMSGDPERFGERRTVDEQWEDATAGLTSRQAGALSTCYTATGNLFKYAVMPKPQWELLLTQCEMLTRDVGAMLASDITTRARAELAPALAAVNRTVGAIEGARQPEPKVREMATSNLSGARFALSQLVEHGVWVDETGNVRVSTDEELSALIEKSRPKASSDGEDGTDGDGSDGEASEGDTEVEEYPFTIEGTNNEIVSESGEDAFKKRYKPLSQDQLRFAGQIVELMGKDVFRFEGYQQAKSPLKDMETILRGYTNLLNQLAREGLGEKVAALFEGIKARIDKAHAMVVAKLANSLPVALGNIQSATVAIEQPIRNTIALPRRVDPNWPEDLDGDGEIDRRPQLETSGLRRNDEVTRLQRADPVPDDAESSDAGPGDAGSSDADTPG